MGANRGLGEAPKSCTRKEHESATNSIAKRGQGAIAPCRVKGQRPLWGLGQRPNCSAADQHLKRTQQRRRQRSVPASNFARPQTRPQAALPPRFREEPNKTASSPVSLGLEAVLHYHSLGSIPALRTGLSSRNSMYWRIRRYGAIISGESTHPAEPVVSIVRSQFTCAAEIGT